MTQDEKVQYWLDIADSDLEVAEDLYKTKRWLYVAFMCHQVVEKTLKAYWSAKREDIPPYIHNHKRLSEGCGLYEQMSEEQKDFINAISTYNIQARYPEYKSQLAQILGQKQCRYIIDTTKELQSWIKSKL
jgi:HEPN domain-containing protein